MSTGRKGAKPWEEEGNPWGSESKFITWVRGVLRKGWSKYPLKILYKQSKRRKIPNPKEKFSSNHAMIWGIDCELCGIPHVQADIEVDHIGDSSTFRSMDDVEKYARHLFMLTYSDMRCLCKSCHAVVSHMQKHPEMSFEDAKIDKEVIRLMKKENKEELLALLEQHGYNGLSNAAKRKKALEEILRNVS
jgi:hypothetical protein